MTKLWATRNRWGLYWSCGATRVCGSQLTYCLSIVDNESHLEQTNCPELFLKCFAFLSRKNHKSFVGEKKEDSGNREVTWSADIKQDVKSINHKTWCSHKIMKICKTIFIDFISLKDPQEWHNISSFPIDESSPPYWLFISPSSSFFLVQKGTAEKWLSVYYL